MEAARENRLREWAVTVLFVSSNGFEFTLILFAANVSLVLAGPGEAALDRLLAARGSPALARLLC